MRRISFFLLLILVGCKRETKNNNETGTEEPTETTAPTEIEIDPSVAGMWNDFTEAHPEYQNEGIPESDFFHDNEADAQRLAELTLMGKKSAWSGLYRLYQLYQVDLPTVGTKQIVTDFKGKAKAIIENVRVDTLPFHKISREYAEMDMGTDVEALEKWKKAHWAFFENFLKESGDQPTEEMLIVTVEFKKIWPNND